MNRKIVFVAAFIVALFAVVAVTDEEYRILRPEGDHNHPGGDLSEKDLGWPKLNDIFENEHTFLMARLDQGYWFFLQIFAYKYGPQELWGIYGIVADDKGKKWFARREVKLKDIKLSHDNFSWQTGGTSVSGAYPQFNYVVREDAFGARLSVKCRFPGWRIGRTNLTADKKTYSDVYMHIPWGRVSGTLTLDGKEIPVTGNAYGDHFHGNQRFDRADPLFYSVRALSALPGYPDMSIEATYNHFHPTFGKISTPGLIIMGQDGFIKATLYSAINGQDFEMNRELGYYFPKRLIVKSDTEGFSFRGVFHAQRCIQVLDILAQLPPYVRKVAEVFFKLPVMSKWDGVFEGIYTLNGKETKFKIRALSEINYVGGRDAIPKL